MKSMFEIYDLFRVAPGKVINLVYEHHVSSGYKNKNNIQNSGANNF